MQNRFVTNGCVTHPVYLWMVKVRMGKQESTFLGALDLKCQSLENWVCLFKTHRKAFKHYLRSIGVRSTKECRWNEVVKGMGNGDGDHHRRKEKRYEHNTQSIAEKRGETGHDHTGKREKNNGEIINMQSRNKAGNDTEPCAYKREQNDEKQYAQSGSQKSSLLGVLSILIRISELPYLFSFYILSMV